MNEVEKAARIALMNELNNVNYDDDEDIFNAAMSVRGYLETNRVPYNRRELLFTTNGLGGEPDVWCCRNMDRETVSWDCYVINKEGELFHMANYRDRDTLNAEDAVNIAQKWFASVTAATLASDNTRKINPGVPAQ